jgi:hypothetical protein
MEANTETAEGGGDRLFQLPAQEGAAAAVTATAVKAQTADAAVDSAMLDASGRRQAAAVTTGQSACSHGDGRVDPHAGIVQRVAGRDDGDRNVAKARTVENLYLDATARLSAGTGAGHWHQQQGDRSADAARIATRLRSLAPASGSQQEVARAQPTDFTPIGASGARGSQRFGIEAAEGVRRMPRGTESGHPVKHYEAGGGAEIGVGEWAWSRAGGARGITFLMGLAALAAGSTQLQAGGRLEGRWPAWARSSDAPSPAAQRAGGWDTARETRNSASARHSVLHSAGARTDDGGLSGGVGAGAAEIKGAGIAAGEWTQSDAPVGSRVPAGMSAEGAGYGWGTGPLGDEGTDNGSNDRRGRPRRKTGAGGVTAGAGVCVGVQEGRARLASFREELERQAEEDARGLDEEIGVLEARLVQARADLAEGQMQLQALRACLLSRDPAEQTGAPPSGRGWGRSRKS